MEGKKWWENGYENTRKKIKIGWKFVWEAKLGKVKLGREKRDQKKIYLYLM